MVRILDLYCGMGGLSLGFLAGLEGSEALGLDIDRYAVMTYNYNLNRFNAKAKIQDVLEWEPKGDYDIIIGGVPCQPYSLANTRRRGREHPLYPTLPRFFDVVLELKPKVFLMENVKGLITKKMKPLLLEQLRRVMPHYRITYRVLNAAYYGVPQRRERLFVLGIRRDLGIVPELPEPTHAEHETVTLKGKLYRWITVREAIGDLLVIPPLNQNILLRPEQTEKIRKNEIELSHRPDIIVVDPPWSHEKRGCKPRGLGISSLPYHMKHVKSIELIQAAQQLAQHLGTPLIYKYKEPLPNTELLIRHNVKIMRRQGTIYYGLIQP